MSVPDEFMHTEADTVHALALTAADPRPLDADDIYSLVVPTGAREVVLDLERFLAAPRRTAGTYSLDTLHSFVDYAANHRSPERTTVWIDQQAGRLVAVLDDHAPGGPGWGEHQAHLKLIHTTEWDLWTRRDGTYTAQEEFAEHIQDGLLEIVEPDGATMLEIAQTIQGKTKADWKSARRLDNGEMSFSYQEEIEAGGGRSGTLEIPALFKLSIAPFYGEQPAELVARLRYRIREGRLVIGYRLDRPHEVVLRTVTGMADRLRDQHGFANVYMGSPRNVVHMSSSR